MCYTHIWSCDPHMAGCMCWIPYPSLTLIPTPLTLRRRYGDVATSNLRRNALIDSVLASNRAATDPGCRNHHSNLPYSPVQ